MSKVDDFELRIRQALRHLYDPSFLRQSPLIKWLKLQDMPNPAWTLKEILEEGIHSLQNDSSLQSSKVRRGMEILSLRYIQQFTQQDVANQMGISPRHLRREQNLAIQLLAQYLRRKFHLPAQLPPAEDAEEALPEGVGNNLEREMLWLSDSLAGRVSQVESTIQKVLPLAEGLAIKHNVRLTFAPEGNKDTLAMIAPSVLRQVILSLLVFSIQAVPGGQITLNVLQAERNVLIQLEACKGKQKEGAEPPWKEMDIVNQLVETFQGEMNFIQAEEQLLLSVSLPQVGHISVLAIEDNSDTLQLWERYLQNSRFSLIGVQDPQQALSKAIECQPDIIILDVMMPNVDGWELLTQLRHHPSTSHIPVIVCTVLPQEELAFHLGASGFLRKPFTREALQEMLGHQIEASKRPKQPPAPKQDHEQRAPAGE
ncbi:MAG: response regulator [Anaerolineae bacterium]|nr:response regulator [Anaerolineae bacterium]